MPAHRVYCVDLRADTQLFGLPLCSHTTDAPWRVELPGTVPPPSGELLRRSDDDANDDALEARRPAPDAIALYFGDQTQFFIDEKQRPIRGRWPAHFSFEDALVYVIGPALGAGLRLLRRSVLHASAVEVDGRALVVMGEAGAGKSTLTASLVDAGQPLITEDVSALTTIDGAPALFRGGSRIKLWDESVRALRGAADALPLLVPSSQDWHTRYLDAAARLPARVVTPIGVILVLERDSDANAPSLESLATHERAVH